MFKELVAATSNKGKLAELNVLLKPVAQEILPISRFCHTFAPEENGKTFTENAMIKALEGLKVCGLPTFAEDSGLMVDALGSEPGVYSARYFRQGDDAGNTAYLLEKMQGIKERGARFVCAAVLALPDGRTVSAQGSTEGYILTEPQGQSGFGYDPIFYSVEINKPFGLCAPEEKNAVSHRKKAIENLIKKLRAGQYD